MRWVEVSAEAKSDIVAKVASALQQYGQGGAVIEERQSESSGEKTFAVKIYLPYNRSYKQTRSEIEQSLALMHFSTPFPLSEHILRSEDWLDSLKKHFGILEIGENFIIQPSWIYQPLPASTRTIIHLDPGAAFGTGLHPTTRLCILTLERYLKPGMTVLDLGTGSGILAIAAAKLGAAEVLAFDIDPIAVKVARSNIRINNVNDHILVRRGTLSIRNRRKYSGNFNIALANITSRAISDLAQGFSRVLTPGGRLIASGIHSQGLDEVLIKLSLNNITPESIHQENEWYVITAVKNYKTSNPR